MNNIYIYQPDRALLKKQIKKYAEYIKGVVLDAGGGSHKRYASYFNFDKYITLDADPKAKPDILAGVEKIPLEDNSIDSIICTQVLGDVDDPLAALREFYRILRPGGAILLTESLFNEMHDEPRDYWRFTKFGLDRLFSQAGFKFITIDQRGGFFSVSAQNLVRYSIERFNLRSHWFTRLLNPLIILFAQFMMFLDRLDKSQANRKFAIGWCVLAQKQ